MIHAHVESRMTSTTILVHKNNCLILQKHLCRKGGQSVNVLIWPKKRFCKHTTIPCSRWVGIPKTTYNSWTAHGTATKPGETTVLWIPVRNLEDHGCKPPDNQVGERFPYMSTRATNMFTMHKGISSWLSHDFVTCTIVACVVSHSLSFVATSEQVISDVF